MPSDKPDLQSTSRAGPSIELSTSAVVAAYIHEISERHRPADEPGEERTPRG